MLKVKQRKEREERKERYLEPNEFLRGDPGDIGGKNAPQRSPGNGEPITMALKVFNNTEEEITFHFNTSQRYDFVIADEEENKIWRWSRDRMFAMVLGEETLGPDNPEVTYTAQYKSELSPGYYKITGILVAVDRPMRGSLTILVK